VAKDDKLVKEPEALLARLPCFATKHELTRVREHSNLIQCFTTPELMRWPGIESLYGESLRTTRVFGPKGVAGVQGDVEEDEPRGEKRYEDLHARIVEHVRTPLRSSSRERH
jgi:26S proteasome regulatory subunit N5